MSWLRTHPETNPQNISKQKNALEYSGVLFGVSVPVDEKLSLETLWFYLDGYFGFLEPLDYEDTFLIPMEEHSEEFRSRRQKTYEKILEKISEKNLQNNFSKENIKTIEITNDGFLKIFLKNNERIVLNVGEIWNESLLSEKQKQIHSQTREEENKLQNEVAKEGFYNGKLIIEYAAGSAVTAAAGSVVVSSFVVTTPEWKRRVSFKKPLVIAKESLESMVDSIVKKWGYEYDFKTKKFIHPAKNAFSVSLRTLEKMTFADYQKKSFADPNIKTEVEFNNWKQQVLLEWDKFVQEMKAGKTTLRSAVNRMAGHAFWFPIFMTEFRKHQTPANALAGFAEMWLFTAGAKIGSSIKIPNPVVRFLLPMVMGGWAVLLWKAGAEKLLDANRKKWEYFQKSNYSDEKSAILHAASGFWIVESLDGWNGIARAVTGKDFQGMDIGIKRTYVNIPGFDALDFTLPEINFYRTKVSMGTNPSVWLGDAMTRDVSQWNNSVDRYKLEITEKIYTLLRHYYRNNSIFGNDSAVKEAGGKKELFQKELADILRGGEMATDFAFASQMENLILGITSELDNFSDNTLPNSIMNEYISRNVGAMKINAEYVQRRQEALAIKQSSLPQILDAIPIVQENPRYKEYVYSLQGRMERNEDLYANDAEKSMYEYLITNTHTMNAWEEKIKIGNYFAQILDIMMSIKLEKSFLKNISQWKEKPIEYGL